MSPLGNIGKCQRSTTFHIVIVRRLSLAGAQPKTALLFDGQRYGVPAGRIPTTHILKPTLPELDGHPENEHLCLSLARALGLPTASSFVDRFKGEVAIVIERYDRIRQEDRRRVPDSRDRPSQTAGVCPRSTGRRILIGCARRKWLRRSRASSPPCASELRAKG